MVNSATSVAMMVALLAATAPADPVLEQLDPPRRAAVIMALVGLVFTGVALVACAMLGANWVRRMARHRPRETRLTGDPAHSAAENRRLRETLDIALPPSKSQDTVQIDRKLGDTKVDPCRGD